jgi:hypothetical protein
MYDVINPEGRVESRIALATKGRVVGFGHGWVYVARIDEDDLEYLQRFKP